MADRSSLLADFVNITAVDEERAKFYLESSNWQLEVALASFYENDSNEAIEVPHDDDDDDSSEEVPVVSKQKESKPKPRFATVTNLNSSSSDEEGQAFYAGGSEHSGQQVLGPKKKNDFITEMFKSVQEHGAEVVEPQTSSSGSGSSRAFEGVGYKLGQSNDDSTMVGGARKKQQQHTDVILKLWRDGFSLNDGELRSYTDPVNKDFLDSVKKGEIPHELIKQAHGSEIHLNMEDHRHEEFLRLKQKLMPFSGKGHTLGSPTPPSLSSDASPEDKEQKDDDAKAKLNIDKTQPTTNIQIRLADGSRLLGEFNHTHTIGDIRSFIINARPQYDSSNFVLLATFPNRELSNEQTLADAGILNSAIMQRLK